MTYKEIEDIFRAQIENVQELEKVWKYINRAINEAYRRDDLHLAKFQTKMLALTSSALAEASFSKLIHTPHGFNNDEIQQIKEIASRNIVQGWYKCLELSTKKIPAKSNHVPNIVKKTSNLIETYIKEPSLIRNKIAHGQWKKALNRKNTKINHVLTIEINDLTVIDLYRYKSAFDSLNNIIEDIIESPNNAHWQFYWKHISDFTETQEKMKAWTMQEKISKLKLKACYHKK